MKFIKLLKNTQIYFCLPYYGLVLGYLIPVIIMEKAVAEIAQYSDFGLGLDICFPIIAVIFSLNVYKNTVKFSATNNISRHKSFFNVISSILLMTLYMTAVAFITYGLFDGEKSQYFFFFTRYLKFNVLSHKIIAFSSLLMIAMLITAAVSALLAKFRLSGVAAAIIIFLMISTPKWLYYHDAFLNDIFPVFIVIFLLSLAILAYSMHRQNTIALQK